MQNKKKETDEFIGSIKDEELVEVLETLVLANELGVYETIDDIEDKIDTSIGWLEVKSKQRRGGKFIFCIIPIFILILLLFSYLMYGMTIINQGMSMEL